MECKNSTRFRAAAAFFRNGSVRRVLGYSFLSVWAVLIVSSGLAFPLGKADRALWPFRNVWFMFYTSTGYQYLFEVTGELESGERVRVDMRRWFQYPVAAETWRFNEIYRNPDTVHRLAGFVCRQFNRDQTKDSLRKITIVDTYWPLTKGRRRKSWEVPDSEKSRYTYVDSEMCSRFPIEPNDA